MVCRTLPIVTALVTACAFSYAAEPIEEGDAMRAIRESARRQSRYLDQDFEPKTVEVLEADLRGFQAQVKPVLTRACIGCHGPDEAEANLRIDRLDPNLIDGRDRSWWTEVLQAVSSGDMPPEDQQLTGAEKKAVVDWLSIQLQAAAKRESLRGNESSFRRLTRYELNHSLQDLLELPFDFTADLPPETSSTDGFLNNAELLQMSVTRLETIRELAREALNKAVVRGAAPDPVYYAVTMDLAMQRAEQQYQAEVTRLTKQHASQTQVLNEKLDELRKRRHRTPKGARYENLKTGIAVAAKWRYSGAGYALTPTTTKPEWPDKQASVAVIPRGQRIVIDLGDHLPRNGDLLLKIRAGVKSDGDQPVGDQPVGTLRVHFGHQASNNSQADERVGDLDVPVTATIDAPEICVLTIPLSEVVRNPFLGSQQLGQTPNPAEYVAIHNSSLREVDLQIDYVEITAPFIKHWPPASHQRVVADGAQGTLNEAVVKDQLDVFMTRAWRRRPTVDELEQKWRLYKRMSQFCADDLETFVEVLATIIASPNFLYVPSHSGEEEPHVGRSATAAKLALFLWSSIPDQRLLELEAAGQLEDPQTRSDEIERMLADQRSSRFAEQFVGQWLGLESLNHLRVAATLKDSMRREPIELFTEMLRQNESVVDFIHADYAVVNERLAMHYGIPEVVGPHFRRVSWPAGVPRGGVLTQAGLLAMNADGEQSHPLKRGIWLLETILNDPPPPPPPAVPEIDLSDPDILKLTLKERMADHRNDPACMSCHQRIDPWGIALENFDGLGRYRTQIDGRPVDATSLLNDRYPLDGINGLKRHLLEHRQDQIVRSVAEKMLAFALGRSIGFSDRDDVETLTRQLRRRGDGLRTLVHLIVNSELFLNN